MRPADAIGPDVFAGTAFGAWWAVCEAASSALLWKNVREDTTLTALMSVLAETASRLAEGEDRLDARAALGDES